MNTVMYRCFLVLAGLLLLGFVIGVLVTPGGPYLWLLVGFSCAASTIVSFGVGMFVGIRNARIVEANSTYLVLVSVCLMLASIWGLVNTVSNLWSNE